MKQWGKKGCPTGILLNLRIVQLDKGLFKEENEQVHIMQRA